MRGKIARSTPRPPFGPPVVRVAARSSRLASREARKSATIHASSGVIWGMSDESGEKGSAVARRHGLTPQQLFGWRRVARRDFRVMPGVGS
jgi:Transposase